MYWHVLLTERSCVRHLGTACHPFYTPGCIQLSGLMTPVWQDEYVCVCVYVAFTLQYLAHIKCNDSSAFQSTVWLGVTGCQSVVPSFLLSGVKTWAVLGSSLGTAMLPLTGKAVELGWLSPSELLIAFLDVLSDWLHNSRPICLIWQW